MTISVERALKHMSWANQEVSALEAKGFKAVDLDDFDLWAYEYNIG